MIFATAQPADSETNNLAKSKFFGMMQHPRVITIDFMTPVLHYLIADRS
jgi:hypothetical protein